MRTVGISIGRDGLRAVVRNRASKAVSHLAVEVPCFLPFTASDSARLATVIRETVGTVDFPAVTLSVPASWTFVRFLDLPVDDLAKARTIKLSPLEGELPISDDEILCDLLPALPASPNRFPAVSSRRSAVEDAVALLANAGVVVDRVIADPVAIFLASLESGLGDDSATVVALLPDLVAVTVSTGHVTAIRQFPPSPAGAAETCADAVSSISCFNSRPRLLCGPSVADGTVSIPGFDPFRLPSDLEGPFAAALGASAAADLDRSIAGFSLRTSRDAESESATGALLRKVAVAVVAITCVVGLAALLLSARVAAKEVESLKDAARKELLEAAPSVKNITAAATQARERMKSLDRQRKELGLDVPSTSFAISRIATAASGISVREISVEGGRHRVAGEAPSLAAVEAFRTALSKGFPGATVTMKETEGVSRAGAGTVKFTISIEEEVRDAS